MQVEGITWHGVTVEAGRLSAMKSLCQDVLGLTPMIEEDAYCHFRGPDGRVYGLNEQK